MTLTLDALAEAFEAAASVLRRRAALTETGTQERPLSGAVARARAVHPLLGPRQAEVLQLLEEAGPSGTNTGVLSRRMDYDQPNVYLTLRGLITLGFVERDHQTTPHTYRLTELLWGDDEEG